MAENRKKLLKMDAKKIILLLVGIGIIVAVFRYIGMEKVFITLKEMNPYYLLAAIGIVILTRLMDAVKFKSVADKIAKVPYWKILPIHISGTFGNAITPGAGVGGEVVRAYYFSKATGKRMTASLAPVLLDSIMFAGTFAIIAIFSGLFVLRYLSLPIYLVHMVYIIFGLVAAAAIFLLWLYHRKPPEPYFRSIRVLARILYPFLKKKCQGFNDLCIKIVKKGIDFKEKFKMITAKKSDFVKWISFQLIDLFLYFTLVYLLFRGLGVNFSYINVIIVTSLSMLLGFFMILPGGMGAVETIMIALYYVSGVGAGVAAAVTLIDRLLYYISVIGGGYIALLWLGWKYR